MKYFQDFFDVLIAFIIVSACLFVIFLVFNLETSNGEKRGVLVRAARSGLFFKTYEAEMIRGGFSDGSGSNGTPFHFNLDQKDKGLVKVAQDALSHNDPIILAYHCNLYVLPWNGSYRCSADSIRVINKGE